MSSITKKNRVIDYMRLFGRITVLDAVRDLGTTELRKLVSEIRQDGTVIYSRPKTTKNRFGEKVVINEYSLQPFEEN